MPIVLGNRVKETTTTTGTGTLTLAGAVVGFQSFAAIGDGNQTYYAITNGTDWETGLGTYTSSGTTLSRDQVYESSNSNAAVNWGAGDKEVFATFPSEASGGTIATADNDSIGTNEVAWQNFQKLIDRGVVGGVPYQNGNLRGSFSTYAIVGTGYTSYGGVLDLNGDVHFIASAFGRKFSSANVASTYSLISTSTSSSLYTGGVLAQNGDIHFIPGSANVGQKISASGVVSTYSLLVTGATNIVRYWGGVLAPNGDIHFVPYSANRGQKISASGVVSTYSLVFTAGNYAGGVLAPNGDIHFVPQAGSRGQKISAAGVVSTYSLPATNLSYEGGVIAPNGDVHFVPIGNPARGLKISPSGVVSTYSTVITIDTLAAGGVLAPNGNMYFISRGPKAMQIVNGLTNVVVTFAMPLTTSAGSTLYYGGVLRPDGSIVLGPGSAATRYTVINTNSGQFSLSMCSSSYLNKL